MKNLLVAFLAVALLASLAGNALLYQRYSTSRPIMRMGSEGVTRKEYQEYLDYQYGKQILNKLAYRKLIFQAATKENVMPTDKDVSDRIADIERRNPQVLQAAQRDPVKMDELKQDIRMDIAFENIRMKGVTASDAEVAAFYAKNRAAFALPIQAQTTIAVAQNSVDASTAQALLQQGTRPELVAKQPRLRVFGIGGLAMPSQLPGDLNRRLKDTILKMQPGQVAVVPAEKIFLIVRVNKTSQAGVPPLAAIKPLVTRLVRLQKAPRPDEALAKLYRDANVVFEADKYRPFFSDIEERVAKMDSADRSGSPKR